MIRKKPRERDELIKLNKVLAVNDPLSDWISSDKCPVRQYRLESTTDSFLIVYAPVFPLVTWLLSPTRGF